MNNEVLYRVIFSGQAQPPVTPEQLQANLAQRFKLPPDKAQAMIGRGDVVIKKNLPKEDAMRYLATLQQIGAVARMEVEAAQAPPAATPPPIASPTPSPADKRSQETTAEHNPYAAPRARVADVETTEYGELRVFTVQGRIGRLRYLVWMSAVMLVFSTLGVALIMLLGSNPASGLSGGVGLAIIVLGLFSIYPCICIQAQRLHDIGLSAWFILVGIIPFIGGLFNFTVFCWPGKKEENKYGLPPPPNNTLINIIGWILLALGCVSIIGIIAALIIGPPSR